MSNLTAAHVRLRLSLLTEQGAQRVLLPNYRMCRVAILAPEVTCAP